MQAVRKRLDRIADVTGILPARQQSFDRRQQEIAPAKRGLKKTKRVEPSVMGIAGEIEQEIDDFAPGEDRAAGLDTAARRKRLNRFGDRAKSRKGSLSAHLVSR